MLQLKKREALAKSGGAGGDNRGGRVDRYVGRRSGRADWSALIVWETFIGVGMMHPLGTIGMAGYVEPLQRAEGSLNIWYWLISLRFTSLWTSGCVHWERGGEGGEGGEGEERDALGLAPQHLLV